MRVRSARVSAVRTWTYTWPIVTSAGRMLVGVVDASNEEWRAMMSPVVVTFKVDTVRDDLGAVPSARHMLT